MKRIGVKDENGENVCIIDHKRPISKNFWNQYRYIKTEFLLGDNIAFMIVQKL